MLKKRTKIYVLVSLILALIVMIIPNRARVNSTEPTETGIAPVREVSVTLAAYQHEIFFKQLREFADKHSFTIQIRPTKPTGKDFLVQMWREDVTIDGVDGDPGIFRIFFDNAHSERPVPISIIDDLIIDLKGFIDEIPNTTFTVVE